MQSVRFLFLRVTLLSLIASAAFAATPTTFTDRVNFEATLWNTVVDDYSNPAYQFQQTDAQMSSVLGETDYEATWHAVHNVLPGLTYCAGCNGSFLLSFQTTSVGTSVGVFGVGMTITANGSALPYHGYVTFGDGSTQDFILPTAFSQPFLVFWGITAPEMIASIHFGLENGVTTNQGVFALDDLTLGSPCSDDDMDGFTNCGGDCDDSDPSVGPSMAEACDGLDTDCNGAVDFDTAGEIDGDGDGDLSCSDCDDGDPANFFGNSEICDGQDNDCNGFADFLSSPGDDDDDDDSAGDDDDSAGPGFNSDEVDLDSDGYFECSGDCDDDDDTTYIGAEEICDGLDNDCDGMLPADELDTDMDGLMECEGDCDDDNAATYIGAEEICDGLDNDCDGTIEDQEVDSDGDGVLPCDGDCDDTDLGVSPNAAESSSDSCGDGLDNDCDGLIDLDDADCIGSAEDGTLQGSGGCSCEAVENRGPAGASILFLGLAGLILRRHSR